MKNKLIIGCMLCAVCCASSFALHSIKSAQLARADTLELAGVVTEQSYFGSQGLRVFVNAGIQDEIDYTISLPFLPWIPTHETNVSQAQDISLMTTFEDPSTGILRYYCGYDEPSYDNEGGIIDDGIIYVYPSYTFESLNEEAVGIGLNFPGYWVCNVSAFDSLPLDFYAENSPIPPPLTTLSFSYLTNDYTWETIDYNTRDYLSFSIYNHLGDNAASVTYGGNTFFLIRDYTYCVYGNSPTPYLDCTGTVYDYFGDVPPPPITEYLIQEAPPPAIDVGAILWQPVESFLNTEFLPSFTFGDMCLIALGLLLFGVFLKTFLGG